jgi:hypothetical protein
MTRLHLDNVAELILKKFENPGCLTAHSFVRGANNDTRALITLREAHRLCGDVDADRPRPVV